MNRYLVRRKGNVGVWPWTEALAKRKDMEEVFAATPEEALKKEAMPDPKKISVDQLESMSKADLMIFAKVKLGLDLGSELKMEDMRQRIKERLFGLDQVGHESADANQSVRA